jgi:hypothetical protein
VPAFKPRRRLPASIVFVEREADFERDLVMRYLAVFDMAARLHKSAPSVALGKTILLVPAIRPSSTSEDLANAVGGLAKT